MFYRIMRTRLSVIALTFLLMVLICSSFFLASVNPALAATTLGASAREKGRTFGVAVSNNRLSEAQYANVLNTEFNGITPENEMKWDTVQASRGSFNYGPADSIVNYAQSRSMQLRGHTLVWHSQLPGWVSNISSGTELLQVMRTHISNVAGHFVGDLAYWDVVNEAFEDNGSRRNSVFQQRIGNSYIEEAFRAARAADPNVKLCYNDYSTDAINAKSTAIYNMVQDFKSRGVPIDCVGFQAHLIVGQVPSDMQANLQRFANLGVDVQITELDIRTSTPASSSSLQQQATDYARVVNVCLAVSRCNSMTVWGITDRYSWIPDVFPGQGAALLFDDNYNKKPAYNSTLQALNSGTGVTPTPTTPPTQTPTSGPVTPTPTPGGSGACQVNYAVNQWNTGFTANLTIRNTSSTAINGWRLVFNFPGNQQIAQGWNGVFAQSGSQVTITNASWNASLPANGVVNPGFNASWSNSNGHPASFTLNGMTCSIV